MTCGNGAACRNRTDDLFITRQLHGPYTTPQKPSHLRKRVTQGRQPYVSELGAAHA
jgi:hypothetical protein